MPKTLYHEVELLQPARMNVTAQTPESCKPSTQACTDRLRRRQTWRAEGRVASLKVTIQLHRKRIVALLTYELSHMCLSQPVAIQSIKLDHQNHSCPPTEYIRTTLLCIAVPRMASLLASSHAFNQNRSRQENKRARLYGYL